MGKVQYTFCDRCGRKIDTERTFCIDRAEKIVALAKEEDIDLCHTCACLLINRILNFCTEQVYKEGSEPSCK